MFPPWREGENPLTINLPRDEDGAHARVYVYCEAKREGGDNLLGKFSEM